MPKFFIKNEQIDNNKINIIGEDVNHIKNVLRLKIDDDIQICNLDTSINYTCGISKINNDSIECTILKEHKSICESNVHINIFQGLPKADKMELIIQKSVELGANEITPVEMKRCVVKLDEISKKKKIERWQKIAETAAKQSGRDAIPTVEKLINLQKVCNLIQKYDIVLLAYENEKNTTLKQVLKPIDKKQNLKIGIIIGPEGGIAEKEAQLLQNAGAKIITLGNRILRTETVGLVMTGILMYELE